MINLYILSLEGYRREGVREQTTSDAADGNNSGTPLTGTCTPDKHNMVKH